MRVADKMSFDQVNKAIGKNRSTMNDLQNQAATQKRITKPSDDPVDASRVLFARVEQRGTEQYIKNLNYAKSFLDFTEQSLAELTEILLRAKELAIAQSNDASSNPQTRKIVAAEVKQLHDQAIQIGNRKLGERFIFGGFKTTAPPFTDKGDYVGDRGEMKVHIDKDNFLAMNVPGSLIFEGKGLSKDGMTFHSLRQPRTVEELWRGAVEDRLEQFRKIQNEPQGSESRGPASLRIPDFLAPAEKATDSDEIEGVNVFNAIRKFEIALQTSDKEAVQDSIDRIDEAMQQVIMGRTSLGSRVMTIDNVLNSMHSNEIDTKATISNLEDADVFEVISEINKTESALQATLQTSGKLIQKSLMDFVS